MTTPLLVTMTVYAKPLSQTGPVPFAVAAELLGLTDYQSAVAEVELRMSGSWDREAKDERTAVMLTRVAR